MVAKTIEICGQPVHFCASAATPRLYRLKFKRDIFADMQKLTKDFQERNTARIWRWRAWRSSRTWPISCLPG